MNSKRIYFHQLNLYFSFLKNILFLIFVIICLISKPDNFKYVDMLISIIGSDQYLMGTTNYFLNENMIF